MPVFACPAALSPCLLVLLILLLVSVAPYAGATALSAGAAALFACPAVFSAGVLPYLLVLLCCQRHCSAGRCFLVVCLALDLSGSLDSVGLAMDFA